MLDRKYAKKIAMTMANCAQEAHECEFHAVEFKRVSIDKYEMHIKIDRVETVVLDTHMDDLLARIHELADETAFLDTVWSAISHNTAYSPYPEFRRSLSFEEHTTVYQTAKAMLNHGVDVEIYSAVCTALSRDEITEIANIIGVPPITFAMAFAKANPQTPILTERADWGWEDDIAWFSFGNIAIKFTKEDDGVCKYSYESVAS